MATMPGIEKLPPLDRALLPASQQHSVLPPSPLQVGDRKTMAENQILSLQKQLHRSKINRQLKKQEPKQCRREDGEVNEYY